jgi:hypothetical protein
MKVSSTLFHPAEVECSGEAEAAQSSGGSEELAVDRLVDAAIEVC